MSSPNYFCLWMDKFIWFMIQILLTDEYTQGISKFMMLTQRQPKVITGKLKRNYSTCMNNRNIKKMCGTI